MARFIICTQPRHVMAIDKHGLSYLHYAALEGNLPRARELINAGRPVNLQCRRGWSPLHCAAKSCSVDVAAELLVVGADLEVTDQFGNTPLWQAVLSSQGNTSVVELLLLAGGNPHAPNRTGVTPIELAKSLKVAPIISLLMH